MNFEIAPASTEIQANWDDAKFYCFFLSIDGKTGWRLPTIEELNKIYESKNDFENRWYWSSSEINNYLAWSQNVSNGYQYNGGKNNGSNYVRAIRDLKDN